MRKTGIIMLAIMLAGQPAMALDAGGITSATVRTHTRADIVPDGAASTYDSLYVCHIKLNSAAPDTVFAALIDSTIASSVMTGLDAGGVYRFFTLARGASGATDVSAAVTAVMYRIPYGDRTRRGFLRRTILTDESWIAADDYNDEDGVFDLSGSGASDWSLLYYAKAYNGLDVRATQAADSVTATIYAYPVFAADISVTDTTFVRATAPSDSMQINAAGLTRSSLSLPVGDLYQFLIRTFTGNGKDADYELTLTSDGGDY